MIFTDRFNLVDDFFSTSNLNSFKLPAFSPSSKIKETDDGFTIMVSVPGVESKDLSVEADATKSELYVEYKGEGMTFTQPFKKTYGIPQIIDMDSIQVEVELGVLTITMTRKEESTRKKFL